MASRSIDRRPPGPVSDTVGRNRAGFTMIELVVVIVLIAIFATMMVPAIASGRDEASLRAAGRNVLSLLRLARSEAITKQRVHRVCFLPAENAVWIEGTRITADGESRFEPIRSIQIGSALEDRERGESRSDGIQLPDDVLRLDERVRCQIRDREQERFDTTEPPPPPPVRPHEEKRIGPVEMIYFRADGTSDGREILIQDRSGFELAVWIDPITSAVGVESRGRSRP